MKKRLMIFGVLIILSVTSLKAQTYYIKTIGGASINKKLDNRDIHEVYGFAIVDAEHSRIEVRTRTTVGTGDEDNGHSYYTIGSVSVDKAGTVYYSFDNSARRYCNVFLFNNGRDVVEAVVLYYTDVVIYLFTEDAR